MEQKMLFYRESLTLKQNNVYYTINKLYLGTIFNLWEAWGVLVTMNLCEF